jgi:hypothetical protein
VRRRPWAEQVRGGVLRPGGGTAENGSFRSHVVAPVLAWVHLCGNDQLNGVGRWAPGAGREYSSRANAMAAESGELSVKLQARPDTDAEELTHLAGRLRAELLDLDVESVQQLERGEPPEESKGVGWRAAGELVVRLVATPEVLVSLISGVRSWLGRNRVRSVKLTLDGDALEVTGVSSAEQDRLIDLWVARHATGA